MCPVCIASSAVMVVGTGSAGGVLMACIAKFRRCFRKARPVPLQCTQEK
jgi:hypothetical protein